MYPPPFPLLQNSLVVLEINCVGVDEWTLPPVYALFLCKDCLISVHLLIYKFSGSNSSDFTELGLLGFHTTKCHNA
jgi:hypothetical protein